MQKFKLKENGAKEISRQSIKRTIPMMFIVVILSSFAAIYNSNETMEFSFLPFIIPIPIIVIVLFFSFRKGYKRQIGIFESYTLTLNEDGLKREQGDTPSIDISYSEITNISKNKRGWLIIKTSNSSEVIFIPPQLEGYEIVEKSIQENSSIELKEERIGQSSYLIYLSGIAGFILFMGVYFATNKTVIAISGVLLTVLLIWAFVRNINNKNVDNKSRRGSYVIILVALSVIGMMIYKLL